MNYMKCIRLLKSFEICLLNKMSPILVHGVPEKEVVIEPHLYKPNVQYFVVKEGTEIVRHISLTGMQRKECFSTVTHHISCQSE